MREWLKNIDPTVKKETLYIASVTGILSLLLQAGFLIAMHWDYTVLLGNLLGAVTAVGNFFLMGITVQKAVAKEKKPASDLMRLSQTMRLLMQLVVAVLGFFIAIEMLPLPCSADAAVAGHAFARVHPESVPSSVIDELLEVFGVIGSKSSTTVVKVPSRLTLNFTTPPSSSWML